MVAQIIDGKVLAEQARKEAGEKAAKDGGGWKTQTRAWQLY